MNKRGWAAVTVMLVVLLGLREGAYASSSYHYQDLGDLGGGKSQALGINKLGQVAGKAQDAGQSWHAFFWSQGSGMQPIVANGVAQGLNDLGQISGAIYDGGKSQGFRWTAPNILDNLQTLGGPESYAYAVNDLGQVVGYASLTPNTLPPYQRQHAFLWSASQGMLDLGTLGGCNSYAYSLNNQTQVVGRSFYADGSYHAFLWDPLNGMTPLGIAGEVNSTAKDINELGQVVGAFFYDPQNPQYYANAFLWSAMAGFLDLGNLGGAYCMASAINDQGQVVGSAAFIPQKGQRAFLWTAEAGMQDLNDLVSGSPGIIVDAFDINEAGQIVGVTAGGRACLLTLAPLPVTLWLLGPVLLVLPWWRRPF